MDKILKNTKLMSAVALISGVIIILYVIDQYRTKDAFGLLKKAA
jgi:hypothetical protein